MTATDQEEYRALRATIRERGTARVVVFAGGLAAWAALVVATAALAAPPVGTLIPLIALAATFEAVHALHVGVERIGRYLDVFHEDRWERMAGLFARPSGGVALDPLFTILFLLATVANLEPLLPARPTAAEVTFTFGAHALFVLRVLAARAAARRQRTVDSERFRQLKNN